jgi:hypothetical protein
VKNAARKTDAVLWQTLPATVQQQVVLTLVTMVSDSLLPTTKEKHDD